MRDRCASDRREYFLRSEERRVLPVFRQKCRAAPNSGPRDQPLHRASATSAEGETLSLRATCRAISLIGLPKSNPRPPPTTRRNNTFAPLSANSSHLVFFTILSFFLFADVGRALSRQQVTVPIEALAEGTREVFRQF